MSKEVWICNWPKMSGDTFPVVFAFNAVGGKHYIEFEAYEAVRAENEKLKVEMLGALSAREIEFEQDNARLRTANAELVEALIEIKSGGGRAEILGLDKYRCPQCASTEIAEQALAKHGGEK